VLSGGRLRIGIGVGWNRDEYEAVGASFRDRGARCDEQIELLRLLWTQELVTFKGRFHDIRDAGINPLPVQRPIPLWLGGMAEKVVKRVGRLADGWFPRFPSMRQRDSRNLPARDEAPAAIVARMRGYAREAGRDPAAIGIEGRVFLPGRTPEQWFAEIEEWRALGACYIQAYTMEAGLRDADAHLEVLRRFMDAWRRR